MTKDIVASIRQQMNSTVQSICDAAEETGDPALDSLIVDVKARLKDYLRSSKDDALKRLYEALAVLRKANEAALRKKYGR